MIKVIGAGAARTGTMSLKEALETLGYNKCFHMAELLEHPERLQYIKTLHKKKTTNWDALFDGFQAAVDFPTSIFYKEMLPCYHG